MQKATEQEALTLLDQSGIKYQRIEHPAIWSMDDPNAPKNLPKVKNLLLKKKNGSKFYLYLTNNTRVDFKELAESLKISRSQLVFSSETELENLLGLVSGMVTPLSLMHDVEKKVQVLINHDLKNLPLLAVHPNTNRATILLTWTDLLKLLRQMGYEAKIV
ncbi:prolyl-tRNA editing protein [Oenococcus sicerae]|uniref:Prolyl-tRNA editing protein n=1 Tax=Oenococcus sicerae TaxID=2203724 RepID=A0AAJ1RAN7_9LACO|nr:YbaK/EbsC family protein [Oenococcus sicerae]MDN6900320.1 prolyl-tRNA editing protein [Oenococcus sicerae]QAS69896.1 prolyl-tRNA editing protein [Oenococcus sicerae]